MNLAPVLEAFPEEWVGFWGWGETLGLLPRSEDELIWREGEKDGGKEGEKEGGKEGGREGRREGDINY